MTRRFVSCLAVLGLAATIGLGCSKTIYPHTFVWPATGDQIPSHPEPPEGGYYTNWDPYAASVELTPIQDVNPVMTQHILVATVKDKEGNPLPNRRVEWIISKGSVGDIVEVDESGFRASRGYKMGNDYAVSHTNNGAHILDRGNDDPADDVALTKGQTWCVVTSPIEGTTYITAYVPGIYDWGKHKVFATKLWMDVDWEFPPPAVNPTGTSHQLVTKLKKHSDGSPLAGWNVTYKLTGGPSGTFGSGDSTTVLTDSAGLATVTLNQVRPEEGENNIQIDIDRPGDDRCCKPGAHIATGYTTKRWIAPKIAIAKTAPARATIQEQFNYNITVTNPGNIDTHDVTVSDPLPDGIEYVSSTPPANASGNSLSWSLGTMAPGASSSIAVQVRGSRTGTFHNCAEVRAEQGLTAQACADTLIIAPALALALDCVGEIILCEPMPVKVTVRNTGDGPARNIRIRLPLPNGVTTEDGRNELAYKADVLEAGQSRAGNFRLKATQPGRYPLRATANADLNLSADAACESSVVQPMLSVSKTGPASKYVGRPASYQITVTNTGNTVARNTVVVDQVPPGMSAREASDNGQLGGGTVRWTLGDLAAGASRNLSVTMMPTQIGNVKNVVTAQAFCAEARAEYDTKIEGAPGILVEVIDDPDPIEVGGQTTYEIRVTNQGMIPINNVSAMCAFPAELDFVSGSGPSAVNGQPKSAQITPFPVLNPKQVITYRVIARGVKTGDARFEVQVISDLNTQVPIVEYESTHVYE